MIKLGWKHHLHAFFAGRLLGHEFYAEENHVTQLLEMGQHEAIAEFGQMLQEVYIHR